MCSILSFKFPANLLNRMQSTDYKSYQTMKYVAVARNTQTNDADLRSLQNLLRKLLQGQNNHLTRRHFNQHFLWGKVCPCTNSFSSFQIFRSGVSTSFDRLSMFFWFVCFPCLLDRAQQHPVVFQVPTKVHRAPKRRSVLRKGKSAQVSFLVARSWDGLWTACQLPPWDRWTLVCEATPDHR